MERIPSRVVKTEDTSSLALDSVDFINGVPDRICLDMDFIYDERLSDLFFKTQIFENNLPLKSLEYVY